MSMMDPPSPPVSKRPRIISTPPGGGGRGQEIQEVVDVDENNVVQDDDDDDDLDQFSLSEPESDSDAETLNSSSSRPGPSCSTSNEDNIPAFIRDLREMSESAIPAPNEDFGPKYVALEDEGNVLFEHMSPSMRYEEYVIPDGIVPVVLDPEIFKRLRKDQREGLKFLFQNFIKGEGCILGHLMGAGKTLTCISLIHVLLEQSINSPKKSTPSIKNAVMVVPKSVVGSWELEFEKWLKDDIFCHFIPKVATVQFRSPEDDQEIIENFLSPDSKDQVLIISYERFMKFQSLFDYPEGDKNEPRRDPLDLIMFDEAHVLKNMKSQRSGVAGDSNFRVKILITGTPIQNTLEELFRLVDIAQNGLLLSKTNCNEEEFRKKYVIPFSAATLTRNQYKLTHEDETKLRRLKDIINPIIHVRQNPVAVPKHEMLICINLSPLQKELYQTVSDSCRDEKTNMKTYWYAHIALLRQICSHPRLAVIQAKTGTYAHQYFKKFRNCCRSSEHFETPYEGLDSSKMKFIYTLVTELKTKYMYDRRTDKTKKAIDKERVVIVSNYTEVLKMIEKLLKSDKQIKCLNLYGTTSSKKRKNNIKKFNDFTEDYSVFLLSLKAGGTGIDLTGANHLVLVDPDWNPANDEQAIARIWRPGQVRPCYVYRLVNTGTIEEVITKRQLTKKQLEKYVMEDSFIKFDTLPEQVKEIMTLKPVTRSSLHDSMNCRKESCALNGQEDLGQRSQNGYANVEPGPSGGQALFSFGDYALPDYTQQNTQPQINFNEDVPDLDSMIQYDISSLSKWEHFDSLDQLQVVTDAEELPILRKIWGYAKAKETLNPGISFVFYKKTNPIPKEEAEKQALVKDGSTLLDYLTKPHASSN